MVFETIGPKIALIVGLVCLAATIGLILLGFVIFYWSSPTASLLIKVIVTRTVAVSIGIAVLVGGCTILRTTFGEQEGFESDLFISGISLLPLGFSALLFSLLTKALKLEYMMYPVFILGIPTFCFLILVLYCGITRIQKVSEAAATFLIPVILLLSMGVGSLVNTLLSKTLKIPI